MPAKLVLLDRDGVINQDSPDYIKTADEWRALPGSLEAIARLQAHGVRIAVCSNQAGIGRGIFGDDDLAGIHMKLMRELVAAGGSELAIYYCPHHPNDDCDCRKPEPGLLLTAMAAAGCGPEDTIFVGDSEKDLLAAGRAGCRSALVLTGNGAATKGTQLGRSAAQFDDLAAFSTSLVSSQ